MVGRDSVLKCRPFCRSGVCRAFGENKLVDFLSGTHQAFSAAAKVKCPGQVKGPSSKRRESPLKLETLSLITSRGVPRLVR